MKRNLLRPMLAFLLVLTGSMNVMALETYDFQELCMKLGKGGPWAVNDGGDANFTLGTEEAPIVMHYLGDYTDEGFSWNKRFAFEYVEAETNNNVLCVRNKNNKKDKNCGLFSWDKTHLFSILDLKDGDKVTITTLAGTTTFVSTNVTAEVNEGDEVASGTAYTISTTDETTRLDIEMAKATLIAKIEIEPYGVETVPVITVTPKTLKLIPGATSKLTASVSPATETQWSSSDESVATVAEDGTVTAIAAGTATITNSWKSEISDATASDACEITVADVDLSAYPLARIYDFTALGDVTLTLQEDAAGAIWNAANDKNNNVFFCTNEGLELIAVQAAVSSNKGWSIVDGEGLFLATGAGRCAAVGGIKKGQIVEFIYTGDGFYTKSDGSDDGIAKTALNEGVGRAIYQADEAGMIGFELIKGNAVKQINIYGEGEAEVTKKTIALMPGVWDLDGATFAAYAWAGEENVWFPFVELSGVYATQIPDTFTGITLVRLKPATDETYDSENYGLNWNNKWNQTDDIDFTAIADHTVFTITGWGEGEGNSTYTAATAVETAKAALQNFVTVAQKLGIDTTDAEALLASDEATVEQINAAMQTLLVALQQKAGDVVAMLKAFFAQFDTEAATALADYFTAAETALAGTDYDAMREATTALAVKCLEEGKSAMEKVDNYLRKMEDETVNADLDAAKAAIASITDPNEILGLIPVIEKLKDDMTPAVMTYLAGVGTLISEGAAAGKDVSAVQTAYTNVLTLAVNYNAGTATLVEMGTALYELIKAVEAYKAAAERIVFPDNAVVFDFEAAAAAEENPANKNGSAANGQAFYGWEKADKTDSKRQDYKGYEWAEGSVLPEVCQVWRRSDRINGNVKDGGLYCPNDREMAVDGLEPGSKVIIVYDAELATNKELVWAIGDGTSAVTEENPVAVVRATATIDGTELVTGESTIASGAEIVVNSVTPAENGTGYIVFQVKQGMYIKQIAVVPAEEEVSKAYQFVAAEWPAGDPGRISPENVVIDAEANTITVSQTGQNNVALKFVTDKEYTVEPEQRYFTIRATGLSTSDGASYLWWLNNANHGTQVAPTTTYEDEGVTVFAWDIRTCGLGDNFSATETTTLQTTGDWITTFGMTLADETVPAVISYIGFEETVPSAIEEYEYEFVASEWPAGDPGRISAGNVVVDEVANTITVDATGDNNVALNFKTDKVYYITQPVKYFVIQATGLSTEEGKSYLWWLNAKNNGAQVVPAIVSTDDSGLTTFAWDITADATFASGFNPEGMSYLDGTGASTWGWTTTFGMTLADASVPAVISYIGYEPEGSPITAISTIKVANSTNDAIYNLSGQRVVKAQKGLYIINGKKMMVK